MGRRIKKKKKSESFNPLEKDLLEAYLTYYHHAAHQLASSSPSSSPLSRDNDSDSINDDDDDNYDNCYEDESTIRRSNRLSSTFETSPTYIASIEFPALTKEILQQPYLILPSSLESKQRRTIYDLCIHVGLYQTSIGNKFQNRRKVISIFCNGFDYLPTNKGEAKEGFALDDYTHEKPLSFPIMECKPWYFRNDIGGNCPSPTSKFIRDHTASSTSSSSSFACGSFGPQFMSRRKVREVTKHYQEVIQELIDYPYKCIRENGDEINLFTKYKSKQEIRQEYYNIQSTTTTASSLMLIDTSDKMKQCAKDLLHNQNNITELAFDLEAYNGSKYKQATCLIQLCTNTKKEYVIDVLAKGVWDEVSLLAPLFADPSIVKIGHGITSTDIPCLHRDFGIFVVNGFDTMEAAKILGLKNHLSLIKLCRYYQLQKQEEAKKYEDLKLEYQSLDWRVRPLTKEMIQYGILDVRFLIPLWKLLIRDMIRPCEGDDGDDGGSRNSRAKRKTKFMSINSFSSESESNNEGDKTMTLHDSMDSKVFETSFTGSELMAAIMESTILEENEEDSEDDENDNDPILFDNDDYNTSTGTAESDTTDFDAPKNNVSVSINEDPISIETLRYNDLFMNTIQKSQHQCLALWTDKSEVLEKNDTLVELMRRAERIRESTTGSQKKKKAWNRSDMMLYKDLFEWRNDVAKKIGLGSAMMCSLDILVLIAYTRPTNVIELKRVNYFLPEFFQAKCNEEYLDDMFSIVVAAGKSAGSINHYSYGIKFYSDSKINDSKKEEGSKNWVKRIRGHLDHDDFSVLSLQSLKKSTIKMSAVLAGIAVFWINISKKKK